MKKLEIDTLEESLLKEKIYEIRNQKVMLDFELAEIYGYETKSFNRQIKNNIERFESDFMFRLTNKEYSDILRYKNCTASTLSSKRRYNPYVFTEQGIYMLMTVLKGELAIKQSKALIRLFKEMKDCFVESRSLTLNTNQYIESKFALQNERITHIEKQLGVVMNSFLTPNNIKQFVIFNGNRIEADIFFMNVYKSAKKSIIIVDDYISIKTLLHLKAARQVTINIFSDNIAKDKVTSEDLNDFVLDTKMSISFRPTHKMIHDRIIIIDYLQSEEQLYVCGPSSKDAGNRIGAIVRIDEFETFHPVIELLLKNPR